MLGSRDRTESIINLIWNRDFYYLVTAGKDAPSSRQVEDFAAEYGVALPEDYLAHAIGHWGSLYIEVKEDFWPRHKAYDVGPFWSFLYGLFVYAYSDNAPDWMLIRTATERFKAMGHQVIPFLKIIGDADVYCFNSEGRIQRYLHEEDGFRNYDGSFFDLLKQEFLELDKRREMKSRQLSSQS